MRRLQALNSGSESYWWWPWPLRCGQTASRCCTSPSGSCASTPIGFGSGSVPRERLGAGGGGDRDAVLRPDRPTWTRQSGFKRDGRDGRFKLIECNPRFTAANELVRQAGTDLARLAYRRALGDGVSDVSSRFAEGARLWHPVET